MGGFQQDCCSSEDPGQKSPKSPIKVISSRTSRAAAASSCCLPRDEFTFVLSQVSAFADCSDIEEKGKAACLCVHVHVCVHVCGGAASLYQD